MEPAYLRQPTVNGNRVVFVCDDDLWSVDAGGGIARRLTAGLSEPGTPVLSPDGRHIAYIGRDEQHPEVHVMSSEGGPARRLTWLGPDVQVRGWTSGGHIVFVTTHGQPFFRNHRAFTIDPAGGLPQLLPLGQVNHLSHGPGGRLVIGRNTGDPARWKRYRGGTAGYFWIDEHADGQFRRMSELRGNLTSPMWIGERIYFLSDFEGTGNLYSCRPDGGALRRHTDHDAFYARHAQTDGERIVYQCAGDLWLHEVAADRTRRLEIGTPSHRTQVSRRFVPAAKHLGGVRLHPAGHSIAADVRGKLFTLPFWDGAVLQHGAPDGVRHRHGQWLADGRTLVAVSDASGEERLHVHEGEAVRTLDWDLGHVVALAAAPVGTRVAVANHRNEVWIGDVADGTLALVDRSDCGRSDDLAWSPDGRWLAYTFATDMRHTAIKLHGLDSGSSVLVTDPEFRDASPSFDPDGKYLAFISYRTYDPVYDSVQFELSFPRAARPYLIALQRRGAAPFDPPPRGLKDFEEKRAPAKAAKSTGDGVAAAAVPSPAPAPLEVHLDGIRGRIAAFPVPENRYASLAFASGGKVLWLVQPIAGAHGRGGHAEHPGRLERFDLRSLETEVLMSEADGYVMAADHQTLLVRVGERLRALTADRKVDDDEAGGGDAKPSRKSGWIDLERLRVGVDPRLEWRQMLREVWRLQRDQFWVPDMSGHDWDEVYRRHAPLVERLATRGELSDLIWEMQGELGTSHAYEMGGDHRKPPSVALGHLGCELRFVEADGSYEITRIVAGDPWDRSADSPLRAVGVEAEVGERIVAVNGQRVSATRPPQALLVHQAGAKVELTLAGASGAPRHVTVTTLADDVPARYREWVETNRAWVHAQSGGKVGYFHLPDMLAAGYAEFHRYFPSECDREGLIVDLRYNRGGHVSSLLLEKLARRRIGYATARWGRPAPYPEESVAGPVVALTNEHAGSDGDIFSHGFKMMGIGPLVGMRTWGGVIGIWPRHRLVDGTETTQPEFSFWFKDVGWGVENYGTDPDIEVDNAPQDGAAGRDRQLETALAEALARISQGTPGVPELGPRPRLARPPLPPR